MEVKSASSKCSSHNYPRSLLSNLNQQRNSGDFCDIELIADGISLKAHRAVLSASSPYFHAMFSTGLKEQDQSVVELHLIPGPILESILDFIYSGGIEITSNNVQELLVAADMLQLAELVDLGTKFLKREMHSSNVIGIYQFSEVRPFSGLKHEAENFIYRHFPEVSLEDEFIQMPLRILSYFLSSEFLRVDSENQVFQAAIRWVSHDIETRRRYIFDLLRHIRVPLLSTTHLELAIHSCNDVSLRVALKCLHKSMLAPPTHAKASTLGAESVRPRLCAKKDIFVVGGSRREMLSTWTKSADCHTYNCAMRFDTFKRCWCPVSPMRLGRVLPGVAAIDGKIYVVGGEQESQILANGERYDPQENTWSKIASMVVPRCEFGLCALDGELFAIGGWIGEDLGKSIEKYDPVADEWSLYWELPDALFSMGVAAYEGIIYVVGGCSHLRRHLQDLRSFNVTTKEWESLPAMTIPRSQMGICVTDGYLYVVGGTNRSNDVLRSAERFSFKDNRWQMLSPMQVGRTCPAVAAADGLIYAIGGMHTQEVNFWRSQITIQSVECYDPITDTWRECPSLPESRGEAGVVVV